MDPAESLNLETETSLLLQQEMNNRGNQVFWLEACDIALLQQQV